MATQYIQITIDPFFNKCETLVIMPTPMDALMAKNMNVPTSANYDADFKNNSDAGYDGAAYANTISTRYIHTLQIETDDTLQGVVSCDDVQIHSNGMFDKSQIFYANTGVSVTYTSAGTMLTQFENDVEGIDSNTGMPTEEYQLFSDEDEE